ncbi:MAG: hypothetical protein U0R69_12085 [Gaiellales bacterium]
MANDTVTLALEGDVSLPAFAEAVQRFSGLVDALSRDVAGHPELRWVVSELEAGSALATARGVGEPAAVESVADAYLEVGQALERGVEPAFAGSVRDEAFALMSVMDHEIEAIRFETAKADATVRRIERPAEETAPTGPPAAVSAAYGGVQGRVQTLTSRGGLRFTLYDTLFDRAVSCYLEEGMEDIMRDVWGRVAVVEGWVMRDRVTGRPQTVRRVRGVTVVHGATPDAYLAARGAVQPTPSSPAPEITIRRLRDA